MTESVETVTGHPLVTGGEFIVLRGDLGGTVLWNVGYSGESPEYDSFVTEWEIDSADYLGDPSEDHYQGTLFTRLIRRKADGAVFGSHYWYNPGIDHIEGQAAGPEAEDLSVKWDWKNDEPDPVIFLPVRRFERVGYEVDKLPSED